MNRPFFDACGTIDVESNATLNMEKGRYFVSEFLKNPVSWLETESLYYSYTTRGEAQEVAIGIDRMISEGTSWPEQVVSSTQTFKRNIGYSVLVLTQE